MHRNQKLLDEQHKLYLEGLYDPEQDPDAAETCYDPAIFNHDDEFELEDIFKRTSPVTLTIDVDLLNCEPRMDYVYILMDPRDGGVCYVGRTNKPFSRFLEHATCQSDYNPKLNHWLKELKRKGLTPAMRILKSTDHDNIVEAESAAIRSYRHLKIFNIRD